eukprot:g29501.t1
MVHILCKHYKRCIALALGSYRGVPSSGLAMHCYLPALRALPAEDEAEHECFNWLRRALAAQPARPEGAFSATSWNVLARAYVRRSQFEHCHPQAISWRHRRRQIEKVLALLASDLLLLQEVDSWEDLYRPMLTRLGYQAIYAQRTGGKVDGCVIAWKKSKFRLGGPAHRVHFDQLAHAHGTQAPRFLRNNVGLFVLLLPRDGPDTPLLVATLHLYWNPAYPDVKLKQCAFFLQHLQHYLRWELSKELQQARELQTRLEQARELLDAQPSQPNHGQQHTMDQSSYGRHNHTMAFPAGAPAARTRQEHERANISPRAKG